MPGFLRGMCRDTCRLARTAMPSASYSSCSDWRVSSMKSCCSFSLQ